MKWLTFETQLEPGFRVNLNDIILIVLALLFSIVLGFISSERGIFLLPVYIAITFFLFCNVFRIAWWHEIAWYIPFMITTYYALLYVEHFWLLILGVFEPLKIVLIVYRVKRGPYVGIMYKRIGNYDGYKIETYRERIVKHYQKFRDLVNRYR